MFQRLVQDQFTDETVAWFQNEVPELIAGIPAAVLRDRVVLAIAHGRSYGMRSGMALLQFVWLMLAYGPDFTGHPRIKRILADAAIAPDDRVDALLQGLPGRVWEELEILADDDAWPESEAAESEVV